jgi:AcrR family transcriptional regulator
MSGKGLPEFLKKARQSALRKMATQMGAAPSSAATSPSPASDGFGGGGAASPFVAAPLPGSADAGALWGGGRQAREPPAVSAVQREAVLAAACQLFAGSGFGRVTLEDVGQQAGVDRATVRAVCSSKEDLLLQAATREVQRFVEEARAWLDPRQDVRQTLRAISERAFEYMGHRPLLLQLMLGLLTDLAPANEAQFADLRLRFVSVIEGALRIGVDQGVLRPDIQLPMTATLLFELHVSGYLLHTRNSVDKAARAAERRQVALDLVFNGLRAR